MKKIMIVDDEKISLLMAEHILSTEYQTVCATSGDEAISLYLDEQPDMVLSDLRMPGIDGHDLQLFLQAQFQEKIPFMFMTADKDEELERISFENGAMDFIHKPFRADALLQRVDNILQAIERKKASLTDPMTGLLNADTARHKIHTACQSTFGALMVIYLDGFKNFTKTYGQEISDKLMIRFSEIIQSAVRSTDITGRLSEEHFVAFCKNVTDDIVITRKTEYINEQLQLSIKQYTNTEEDSTMSAFIGSVFVPDEGNEYDDLYKKAKEALKEAQNQEEKYHIFKTVSDDSSSEASAETEISRLVRAYDEPTFLSGAFTLPEDQFRIVLQFLRRYVKNYKKEVWILLFSVQSEKPEDATLTETTSNLLSILHTSLRRSDVITRCSDTKIMVLLQETSQSKIEFVTERIMNNWDASGFAKPEHTIIYDKEAL